MATRISKICAMCSVAILSMSMALNAGAGVQETMNKIFGDMTNVTKPGVFKTQRRGIITGGSFVSRSKIVDTSLANLTIPHADGGCGGIDAFGGAFSFINADQFVQLLRSIAANAKGYAFHIAIHAASEMIGGLLEDLQRVAQSINNMNINSCQLAQGIVNTGLDAVGLSSLGTKTDLKSALNGFGDVADAFLKIGSTPNPGLSFFSQAKEASANGDTQTAKKAKNLYGNLVWQQLKDNNMQAALNTKSSNAETDYKILMSITGTIIIPEPKANEETPQTTDFHFEERIGILDPEDYIEGGKLKYYNCSGECLEMSTSNTITENVVGLKTLFYDKLNSLITKYNTKAAFTEDDQKFAESLPGAIGTIVQRLSTYSGVSESMANDIAYAIAGHFAFDLMVQQINVVRQGISNSKLPKKDEMDNILQRRQMQILAKAQNFYKQHKTIPQLLQDYIGLQTVLEKIEVSLDNYGARRQDKKS